MLIELLTTINEFILCYFIGSVVIYTLLLLGSFFSIAYYFKRMKYSQTKEILDSKALPPVTIIMPAYNEEENIVNAIKSTLNSSYHNLYVIMVNDASTDNMMGVLNKTFQLEEVPVIIESKIPTSKVKAVYVSKTNSNFMVIDKEKNAGSGDSINMALNACFTPYFVTVDADSLISTEAITEFIYDIMTNPSTVIVGGGVYILNACKYKDGVMLDSVLPFKLVPAIQAVEYIRSHLFSRTGWNLFGGTMGYSGTATLLDRKTVIAANGYDTKNFSYDVEVVMKVNSYLRRQKKKYRLIFNPVVTVWTDVPHGFREYAGQRDRWRRGMIKSALRYWYMFLNPKYGIQGMIGYPCFILLEILAPLIEFTAYISLPAAYFLGILNWHQTLLYIVLAWGFVSYLSIANMFINLITFNRYKHVIDIMRIFALAVIETFGFRQFTVLISVYGTFHYFINRLRGKPV